MFCEQVEEFLSQRGVHYTVRDVTTDKEALEELQELGYMTTPVIVIDGEVVVGFDRERLEHLLAE